MEQHFTILTNVFFLVQNFALWQPIKIIPMRIVHKVVF
jgi:hypothetical protein